MNHIYYCEFARLYFGRTCAERNPLLYGHADIDVSDMLTLADLASRELGYDLAAIRYDELFGSLDDREPTL